MQRRRFIRIIAGSIAGLSVRPLSASSLQAVQWNGYTMGSEGSFTLYGDDTTSAQRVIDACFKEMQRLERCFSLYRQDSEICQLNREGRLENPSSDWSHILQATDRAYTTTEGLFDPTIQNIWKAYQSHFEQTPDALTTPDLQAALERTGWQHVNFSKQRIEFEKPDIQLSLNGIAQGYITDRITEMLREEGFEHALVELGETRALGCHPEQRPWSIGLKDPSRSEAIGRIVQLDNQALATSGGYGSTFSADGTRHHLIHPRTGHSETRYRSLSVIAPTATEADALSTGLILASESKIQQVLQTRPTLQVIRQD
ncbi:FAD:protein FMN transferase [Coraliomargarita akajimensis]|uniref:FAD:protein FMN transferase n=1 Tax=Coraliomargarita akajimensis (strain DSM 45221 / IAM 15411 / JCM 23193 / KCTC 12865 / 04OKA010-24) TaxID=583355 RepID=D5EK98_CORAD|nr:FAD:protein FMN transferase [Coraliomargarita akajimensis]ADE54847.1 ApbE family lipoprotein [Coraliomargarita akajimensis DSM 45221]